MQASCDERAIRLGANDAAVLVRDGEISASERGHDHPAQVGLDVVRAGRDERTRKGPPVDAVDAQRAAPAARHVGELAREGHVLRREVRVRRREQATRVGAVDSEPKTVTGADPGVAPVRGEADVVREERRPEATNKTGPRGRGDVDDRDLGRLASEGDPERPPGRVHRDVPRAVADALAGEHPPGAHVDRCDLAALRVGHVGVAPVRMTGGVPRLAEVVQLTRDRERRCVDEREGADVGVRDDGGSADALDAARECERRHVSQHVPTRHVDGDEPRLEVGRDECNAPRRLSRANPGRQEQPRGAEQELAAVHGRTTATARAQVPLSVRWGWR